MRRCWLGLVALIVAVGHAAARPSLELPDDGSRSSGPSSPRVTAGGDASYRLPGDAAPLSYTISITPRLYPDFAFTGSVGIKFQVLRPTSALVLHADQLDISLCLLDNVRIAAPTFDAERQFVRFALDAELANGTEHALSCDYTGKVHDDDKGFYRSSYHDENGVLKWLGVTQFEMTFARRAFPCFDEPGFRATFTLIIVHGSGLSVVSNTRPKIVEPWGNDTWATLFEPTPAMASYTLAWMVSEMPSVSDADRFFRTFAQPAEVNRNRTALSQMLGPQVLSVMENYTGIPYKLDKMDQVAVPDHNFGAMENWGLVTYRQALLLSGETSRSATNLSVATTIAHELAHQWFGNLVTPSWWSHVWLSEGFAELFCYLTTDKILPDWNVMDKMAVLEMHDAFIEDSLESSLPMTHDVYTPDEILDNFGTITYAKGSSVLRMLQDAVTPEVFQKGLQTYLTTMQESGSVRPDDLWAALESALASSASSSPFPDGVTFTDLARSWVDQAGYPLVTVARTGKSLSLSQERFLSTGAAASSSASWLVPVAWRAAGRDAATVQRAFLAAGQDAVVLGDVVPEDAEWVLVNADQIGYYRVNYDAANWRALARLLQSSPPTLRVAERAMLVDDALSLARAGRLDYAAALDVVAYLGNGWETAYAPWASLRDAADYLAAQLRRGVDAAVFDRWLQSLTEAAYHSLGFASRSADEPFDDKLSRGVVARLALESGLAEAVADAKQAYASWKKGGSLDPDTVSLALCQGLADGDRNDFYGLFTTLSASEDEAERADYTYALGCAKLGLKEELLHKIASNVDLRVKDVLALWKSVASSAAGLSSAIDIVIQDFATINATRGESHLSSVISALAARIVTQDDYNKLLNFAGDASLPASLKATLSAALDTASLNLAWRAKYESAVIDVISAATAPPASGTTPSTPTPTSPYRLPAALVPTDHTLLIVPNVDEGTFNGSVAVALKCVESTTSIALHAVDLEFQQDDVQVSDENNNDISVTALTFDARHERVDIGLGSTLTPGRTYYVMVKYRGPLRTDLTGLYVATPGGVASKRVLGVQAYPAYARRLLPCLDEPAYRATFLLSVARGQSETAVSNADLLATSDPDPDLGIGDRVVDVFMPTQPIPTSRLGLIIGELDAATDDKKTVRLLGRDSVVGKAGQTLSTASTLLSWFKKITGVTPKLSQLTLAAVSNVLTGASETSGLLTFREAGVVNLNKSPSSGESEQTYITQLARNLAQIWFGDLVSFDWWSDAWLGEGFATYFQYAAAAQVSWSTWKLDEELYTRAIAPALLADSLEGSNPLSGSDVDGSQESIASSLDEISSGKGAAVVQMMRQIVERQGDIEDNNNFYAGLKVYLEASQLSSASPSDLYAALQQVIPAQDSNLPAGATLADVMKTWTERGGYPVVIAVRDYEAKTATLTQERFLLHAPSSSSVKLTGDWWVPVSYALRSGYYRDARSAPIKTWLGPEKASTVISLDDSDQWLLVNIDRRGFYRVNYDVQNWKLLKAYLLEYNTVMEELGRAMLVDDVLALSRSGHLDYAVALDFLDYLRVEYGVAPWQAARSAFDYLDAQLYGSDYDGVYKTWMLQILDRVVQLGGFEPEPRDDHVDRLTREIATSWACDLGHAEVTRKAKNKFTLWLQDPNSVGHDVLAATICAGVRDRPDAVPSVLEGLLAEQEDSSRAAIIHGLGCVETGDQLKSVLNLTTSAYKGQLRRGESAAIWKSVTRFGASSMDKALSYLNIYSDSVLDAAKDDDVAIDILTVLADRVTTDLHYLEVAALTIFTLDTPRQERLKGPLLLAAANLNWRDTYQEQVGATLYSLTGTSPTSAPTRPALTSVPPTRPASQGTPPTPGGTGTDPATRVPSEPVTFWTLPASSPTSPRTLPPLETPAASRPTAASESPRTTTTPSSPDTTATTAEPSSASGLLAPLWTAVVVILAVSSHLL